MLRRGKGEGEGPAQPRRPQSEPSPVVQKRLSLPSASGTSMQHGDVSVGTSGQSLA